MDCSMPDFPVLHDPGACSNSLPLSWWCYPTISSSGIPFSCPQSVFSSVQSFSRVRLFVTPWTTAHQASLSITTPSLLKLMSSELVMPSNHLILCLPLLLLPSIFASITAFSLNQFFTSGDQSIGVAVSASVLPMNIQDWLHLGWISWISLQSKWTSRLISNTTVQKH